MFALSPTTYNGIKQIANVNLNAKAHSNPVGEQGHQEDIAETVACITDAFFEQVPTTTTKKQVTFEYARLVKSTLTDQDHVASLQKHGSDPNGTQSGKYLVSMMERMEGMRTRQLLHVAHDNEDLLTSSNGTLSGSNDNSKRIPQD